MSAQDERERHIRLWSEWRDHWLHHNEVGLASLADSTITLLRASAPPADADIADLIADMRNDAAELRDIDMTLPERLAKAADALAALAADNVRLREALTEMEARKNDAYTERNKLVAWLARCYPSGIARTAIAGDCRCAGQGAGNQSGSRTGRL